jgi:hypothetical protein
MKRRKRKMANNSKRVLLFTMVFLTVLLISSAFASLLPIVNAAEPSVPEKTISILNDVVGINTKEYASLLNSQLDNQYLCLSQKQADIHLVSNQSSLRVSCSFVNNNLRLLYLSDYAGSLSVKHSAIATVNMAKGFLQGYRNYAGDSFYSELASMLDNVDITMNTTKSAGNVKLEVLNSDNTIVDYVWTYTDESGILAKSKNVILSYDQGQLKVFLNNWPLYKVAGMPKISAEEATAIAIEASKNFSYEIVTDNVASTVTGFKIASKSIGYAKLSYVNFPNQSLARGGDPLTLYPSWYVPLGFDKFYPGDVTGMTVSIWADTGEISIMGPMVADSPLSSSAVEETVTQGFTQQSTVLSTQIVIVALFSLVVVSIVSRKTAFKLVGSRKRFSRFWGTLICGIILFSAILIATPKVDASPTIPNSKSRVYACLDTPDGYDEPAYTPEREATIWVCGQVADAFVSSGYSTSNLCGAGTIRADVLWQTQYDEEHYDRATVFHVGHRSITGYQDNYGTPITPNDILGRTTLGKHKFVFLWVCDQATSPTFGMPYAWTQRTDMHANGYLSPDCSGQCFIGFDEFSPIISGYHQTFQSQMTGPCKNFIKYFYDYALRHDYAVRDALNLASIDFFQQTYTACPLYGEDGTGYYAWYPNYNRYEFGYMRVFGDGSMWLFQPKITLTTNCQASPTFYLNGDPHYIGDVHVWPEIYTISVSDIPNYVFDHFSYHGNNFGRPANFGLYFNGELTAHYNWNPTYYTLSISSSGGGYTVPTGDQQVLSYNYAHVEAVADPGWTLNHWLLDGYNVGSDPSIDVYMDGPHSLQAVFSEGVVYHWLTVNAYDIYYQQWIDAGVWVDGYGGGYGTMTVQVPEGWRAVGADEWYYPLYLVGFSDGYGNGASRPIYSDTTITAYYDLGG